MAGPSFVAYVDESGCEGFRFDAGSTAWFTLCAVMARKENERHIIDIADHFGKIATRKKAKFKNLRADKRADVLGRMVKAPLRTIVIAVDKTKLTSPESFHQPHRMYFYFTRYLIERVSWMCRDAPKGGEGDGSVQLIFHQRDGLPYKAMVEYFDRLKCQDTAIAWKAISTDRVESATDHDRIGIRLADATANSFYRAFGKSDCTDALSLKPITYAARSNPPGHHGYGLKCFPVKPGCAECELMEKWG
jgi:hypothetical protein